MDYQLAKGKQLRGPIRTFHESVDRIIDGHTNGDMRRRLNRTETAAVERHQYAGTLNGLLSG